MEENPSSNSEEKVKGEMELILDELKIEAEKIMHELTEMEDILVKMKDHIQRGDKIDPGELLYNIEKVRTKIGIIEHIDFEELNEAQSAENLMVKLKGMISKCI